MRYVGKLGMVVLALALAAACGKSEAEKRQEEAQKHLEEAAKKMEEAGKQAGAAATQSAAEGLDALAKGLGGLAGAVTSDGKPVEPVSFKELQTVFVPLDGWEMSKPTGEKMTSPVSYSQAKVRYHKGDQSIEVSVMDSAFNKLLIIPFSTFLTNGYEKETEDGYEKSVKVAGHPGWEKWDTSRKDGELNAFVNKRFVIQIEGNGIDDTKTLYQLASAMPLAKLADIK